MIAHNEVFLNGRARNAHLNSEGTLTSILKGEVSVQLTSLSWLGLGCFENYKKFPACLETADSKPVRIRRPAVLILPPSEIR